jgi:uroporphyrin-III C-methyltransferase/precorrin-2 dehydrogenase/sirohydrochlorin ferrochelatase
VAEAAARLRPAAAQLPLEQRRRFWDRALDDRAVMAWSNRSVASIEKDLRTALETDGARQRAGKVFLVGAGPGRADLLTLRALQTLGQADVILHDRLVSDEILGLARRDAEFIDVGKRSGDHHKTQLQIHELLLEHARAGRLVVRLKGGDPFVFGRGGEELEALHAAGIEYEVVPGVTAASGCAAFSGIPLTHRELSQALTLVTGQVQADGEAPPWRELAGKGRTLAVYMCVKQAINLRGQLLDAGLSPTLPAALVCDGTRDSQQVFTGTIADLPSLAAQSPARAPGLFIIGEVAALGAKLAWFEPVAAEAAARVAA